MSLKRGKYSTEEEKFIISNVHKFTAQQMADTLGRHLDSVERFIKRKKLKSVTTQDEEDEIRRLVGVLHSSSHWEKILLALTKKEIPMFEKSWVNIIQQFSEDVWHTEEMHIIDWLILDIKKYRTLQMEKEALQSIEDLEEQLAKEQNAPIEQQDKAIVLLYTQQIDMQKAALSHHTETLKKILEKIEKISDKLKANREDRRDIKANEDTYWGYIQMLEDEKFKKQESRQAQIMKMAQDKAREKLYEYHEYMDNTVDIPLLTPDIAIIKQQEKEKQDANTREISNNI